MEMHQRTGFRDGTDTFCISGGSGVSDATDALAAAICHYFKIVRHLASR